MLKHKVLSALGWMAGARLVAQVLSWASTIFVMRLLEPGDYGLMAIGMIFVNLAMMFSDLGIGVVIVQKKTIDHSIIHKLQGLVLSINLLLFSALFISSFPISWMFEEESLQEILFTLAFLFPVSALSVIPKALLERELNFKLQSIIEVAANVSNSVTVLSLAIAGLGVWALIWGVLAGAAIRTLGLNVVGQKFYAPDFRIISAGRDISFGGIVSMEKAVAVILYEMDKFIVGKLLGKESLGFYSVGMSLAAMPLQRVMGTINPIAISAFSRVASEGGDTGYYVAKVVRLSSLVGVPVFLGLSAIAPELIHVFIGDKWEPAILPFQLICLSMVFRMLVNILPSALKAIGRPDVSLWNHIHTTIVLGISFLVAIPWGIVGVSLVWLTAYPVLCFVIFLRSRHILSFSMTEIIDPLKPTLFAGSLMYLSIWGIRSLFSGQLTDPQLLPILIISGAIVYTALLWISSPSLIREGFALFRR